METFRHYLQMSLLIMSLRLAWKDRENFFVAGNMFMYYSQLQARKNDFRGPDVFVVLDTDKHKDRKSWVVWEEDGKTPDVIIELTSPTTVAVDRGEKMRIYARLLRVAEYYLFDPYTAELEGYRLDPIRAEYQPIQPDEQGRLACDRLGLMLGVVPGEFQDYQVDWLRWLDREGQVLPHGEELAEAEAQRAEAEARRAEAEAQRAEAEAQRVQELAAKLAQYEQKFGALNDK